MIQRIRANTTEFVSVEAWRATLAEFIATLLFVFVGAGSVVASGSLTDGELNAARLVAIALTHGLAIALLVYATANLSGGHINPAVTLAAALTRKIGLDKASMYIVAQLAGAVAGAYLLMLAVPNAVEGNLGAHALASDVTVGMGIVMEIVLTFVLVFVVFATAIDPKGMGRLAPLAIGLAVLVSHFVAVAFTGASMNPARSLGPAVAAGVWSDHWVYWVGPLIGGAIASLLYQFMFITRTVEEQPRLALTETQSELRSPSAPRELKEVEILKNLSNEQIKEVASLGQRSHVLADTMLATPRETTDTLFIVLSGQAELSAHSDHGEMPVRVLGPGESFPLVVFFSSEPRTTSIMAITEMDLLAIPQAALLRLCTENPEIGMGVYGAIAEVLGNRYRQILVNATTSAERLRLELVNLESRSFWPF